MAPIIDNRSLQQSNTNVLSLSMTPPTGIQDGDLLVATASVSAGSEGLVLSNEGTGAAWTTLANPETGGVTFGVYAKIASSESGNYLFSWNTNERIVACVYRITGNITTDPWQLGTLTTNGQTDPATALSMVTDTADTLVLAFYGIDANEITDDQADGGTGWTTEYIRETVGGGAAANITNGVSFKVVSNAEASLNATQALDTADNWHTIQVSFRPGVVSVPHSQGIIIG